MQIPVSNLPVRVRSDVRVQVSIAPIYNSEVKMQELCVHVIVVTYYSYTETR